MFKPSCIIFLGLIATARAKMEGFMIDGSYTTIEQHPHSAFLGIHCVTNKRVLTGWVCGSSVVNQRLILSAAHCLCGCDMDSEITVTLGDEYRKKGKAYKVSSFMMHEHYKPATSENDICLLKLNRAITLNQKISRVALLKRPPYSELAKVAGWGTVDEGNIVASNWLKYVRQKVMNRNQCESLLGFLPQGTICATPADKSDGYAAHGDSGSALVVRGYIQIGIVSYKIPDIKRDITVYTDTGCFYDWIQLNSRKLFCLLE